jgi:hypothetical protein
VTRYNVTREHLYASVSLTSTLYDRATGLTIPKKKRGTSFILNGESIYFVTNRHVVDYNFKLRQHQPPLHGAELGSVLVQGHMQPKDPTQNTIPWSVEFRRPRFQFHAAMDIDIAY